MHGTDHMRITASALKRIFRMGTGTRQGEYNMCCRYLTGLDFLEKPDEIIEEEGITPSGQVYNKTGHGTDTNGFRDVTE